MLDFLDRMVHELTAGDIHALLPDDLQAQIAGFAADDIRESCRHVLVRPHPIEVPGVERPLINPGLAVAWLTAFEELELPRRLEAYEPCAGSSEPVILATQVYSSGAGRYVTANLNRPLAQQLREKLAKLSLDITIIDDYAQLASTHLAPGSFDVACFHHAVNDILQTAVSEPRGMDTRTVDWWPNERQMIEWLAEDQVAGRLDEYARPALVAAVAGAVELVRPGGYLLFDHWTWERYRDVDWFPWQLFSDLIPMAREWLAAAGLPLVERPLAGRDPRWWMCLRRD